MSSKDEGPSLDRMASMLRRTVEALQESTKESQGKLFEELNKARTAREIAESENIAKSAFLANMSHELRTPLNSIMGFAQVLQMEYFGKLNEKQKEYVGYILESAEYLLNLINDVLDLSKIESGSYGLEISRFSLRKLVEKSTMMLRERAKKRNLSISIEIDPSADIEIEADERRIQQVLLNLLTNAVKFTPENGSICVRAVRQGQFVEISVTDSGIGIKPEDMNKLFKPFSQLENPYTKVTEGTGLGLALCKRMVELHKGQIWAESEYGKGSTFHFTIPVEQQTCIEGAEVNEKDSRG
ncbi:ATP-binding protein [Pseudothermotoga sp.]|uniref:sensor histidine kinase n=1 Tax=Pseudothermotoga sp. TaxID=2033661 RepID=UPI0031F6D4DA